MTNAIAFCATGKTGLGHLRRITNIAHALRDRRASCAMDLLTNAPATGLAGEEVDLYRRIDIAPRSEMACRLPATDHGPVVVDTAVLPGLQAVARPLCLILRETVTARLGMFGLEGGRPWDLIILPHPLGEWHPDSHALSAKRIESVGYIYRQPRACDPDAGRGGTGDAAFDGRRVLIASGGGGSGDAATFGAEVDCLIAALRSEMPDGLRVVQALGPRLSDAVTIRGADALWRPGADLHDAFARADLIISTVGYNSVLELACTDVPVLLMPVARTYDDQEKRGQAWAERLGLCHRLGEPERSVRWMIDVLTARRRRPPVDLGPSGAARCASLLVEMNA